MSFFTKDMAMDLGTANTLIMSEGKIILNEPSIVAIDKRSEKCIATGKEALSYSGNSNIKIVNPLHESIITDYDAAVEMIRKFMAKVSPKRIIGHRIRIVVGICIGNGEVEIRAIRDAIRQAGVREIHMIPNPIAAAMGIGINVMGSQGNMIVDIGEGSAEIAVILQGRIISSDAVFYAGTSCLDRSIMKIESAIRAVLGNTPPEMYADIVKNGIWLSGGGALLRGLAERFERRFSIPFHQAEDPLTAVARGTSLALKDLSYPFLMK